MRIMAIDYGDARTGIAVSDESASLVGDAWVVSEKNQSVLAQTIQQEATTRNVGLIVIGYPKNMNGTIGPRGKISEQLADSLREICTVDVVLWDERLTTMSASRILADTGVRGRRRRETIDAVAASLILESYLEYLANNPQSEPDEDSTEQ